MNMNVFFEHINKISSKRGGLENNLSLIYENYFEYCEILQG